MRGRGRLRDLTTGVCCGALAVVAAPDAYATAAVHAPVAGADRANEDPWLVTAPPASAARSAAAYSAQMRAELSSEALGVRRDLEFGALSVAALSASVTPPARRAPAMRTSLQPQDPGGPRLNTSGRTMVIMAPFKDGAAFLGDVEVQIAPDDSIQVSVAQVVELLASALDPAVLEPMRPLAQPGVFAPLSAFEQAGLPILFDRRTMELIVAVPTSARARRSIGLAELDREVYGEFASPEDITAYLNIRGSVDYSHVGSTTGLGDPYFSLDGAARIHGVVIESEGAWSGTDNAFSRSGTRAVYDDVDRLNRWIVGDLVPQGRGFQGMQDLAGVSVARSYSMMDPQRNVAPRGGRTFTLDREATVEAFVNGRAVRTIRLAPGSYDVSDFPFVQGSNDVDLVITDDSGRRDVISFSLFVDRTQLAPGLSEYALHAGVLSSRRGSGVDYSDDFAFSGFYRFGFSENLTLGANFQYAQESALVGGEFVWGSSWGTLGGDVAYSSLDAGDGWATNLSYERLVQDGEGGMSIMATVETRSRRFGAVGQLTPDNPFSFSAAVSMNRSFGESAFVGLQARYAQGRGVYEDETSLRFSYGRRVGAATSLVFDIDWADGQRGEDVGFRVAMVRRFGASASGRIEYDNHSERVRLGYQTSGGRGVGAWSAAGNLDLGDDRQGLNASGFYTANRADLGLAHSTAYSMTTNDISDQRTSMRIGTAFAFAGGAFAVGRPISDGFVIVRPYEGAREVAIEVEPSPEGYYARSGRLGPALYGQVSAYSPRTVMFDAAEAPAGFDIGQGALRLLAPYRAGYVVTVGSDYNITAVGRLMKADGEPLALISGVAIEIGGEERRVDIFTNRQGQFGMSGLKAGRWRIEMIGSPPVIYELNVPETPEGVARMGDLTPVP